MKQSSQLIASTLFEGLSTDELNTVTPYLQPADYQQNEHLFNIQEPASSLYLLQSGIVKVSYINLNGTEKILSIYQSGDIFGALFMGKYRFRIGQAVAIEDSRVYKLNEKIFNTMVEHCPQIGLNFIRHLVDEQRASLARIHALQHTDSRSRLLGTLLTLSRQLCCTEANTFTLPINITQEDLANLSGLNRSTVSSTINQFRRRGFFGGEGRSLTVNLAKVKQYLNQKGFEFVE